MAMKKKKWKSRSSSGMFTFSFGKNKTIAPAGGTNAPAGSPGNPQIMRKLLYAAAALFFLISPYFVYKTYFYEEPSKSAEAAQYAETVLNYCDAGDLEKFKTAAGESEVITKYLKNREQLGNLKNRRLADSKPIRRSGMVSTLVTFNSSYDNAPSIQEKILVEHNGDEDRVYSAQFAYSNLPRTTTGTRPSYPLPDFIRRSVFQCTEAFDLGNVNYFKRLSNTAFGRIDDNFVDNIMHLRDIAGRAQKRKIMSEYFLLETLPGCPELQLLVVANS
ncbi:MAG: hypothetical protein RRY34_08240, partial [Victivallaceae bacterium]